MDKKELVRYGMLATALKPFQSNCIVRNRDWKAIVLQVGIDLSRPAGRQGCRVLVSDISLMITFGGVSKVSTSDFGVYERCDSR